MKNILFYGICAVLLAFTSCQQETDEQHIKRTGININVVIDDLETGVKTRAAVSPEPGERTVNSLYLAFFDYDKNGLGSFIDYYKVSGANFEMSSTIAVPSKLDNGGIITDTKDYVILAFANIDESTSGAGDGYVEDMSTFLDDFNNNTENSVLHKMALAVTGAGTDENDDKHAISSSNIFMSARIVRLANETTTTINLTRGVSRFDVINQAGTHTLKSVSIWGAAKGTTVWEDIPYEYEQMLRFYGEKEITGEITRGKLYAFENVVVEPKSNDKETTCLIIGLEKASKIRYYRVNIHLQDAAQNLKRNHSYQITVNSVNGEGSNTEYEAWTQNKNELLVSVNNWNLDDNGMILTDGTNTLGLPVKRIRFDPRGDAREYSLYTVGDGVLEITKYDLPTDIDGTTPAFTAVIEGNVLKVTAKELPNAQGVRRGSIEVSFAGLRGNIDMIQEPSNEKTLYLDRNIIANFGPVGRYGISDGPLTVTASGPWVAQIYNTEDDADNPGFSFEPGGAPSTRIDSQTNPFGDKFQIYTTGDNPYPNDERSGFVIVSLVEDPDNYSVAVPLTQDVKQVFQVLPVVTEVRFNADATPSNTSIATGDLYEFTVNTGGDDWRVELSGGDSGLFEVKKMTQRRFTVKTKGKNGTVTPFTSTIKITSGADEVNIPVIQDPAVVTVYFTGQIPNTGGTLNVNVISSNLPWKAEIVENWNSGSSSNPHLAWLEESSGGTQVTVLPDQAGNGSFKVGFPALVHPLVNLSPKVKVKVSLKDIPSVSQTIEVVQLPIGQTVLKVMDVHHKSYGSLGGSSDYFSGFNKFLRAGTLFGPAGRVELPLISITDFSSSKEPGNISSEYKYLHAGGNPKNYSSARFTSVETWRDNNDGVLVYVCDSKGAQFTNNNSTLYKLNYVPSATVYTQPARINEGLLSSSNTLAKNIMRYLLNDGPFGKVYNPSSISYKMDGTCTSLDSYNTGIPVMINGAGKALVVIDPNNKLVYIGESQLFDSGYDVGIKNDKDKFLGNLISYILNAALNGSVFTEIFSDDAKYNQKFNR